MTELNPINPVCNLDQEGDKRDGDPELQEDETIMVSEVRPAGIEELFILSNDTGGDTEVNVEEVAQIESEDVMVDGGKVEKGWRKKILALGRWIPAMIKTNDEMDKWSTLNDWSQILYKEGQNPPSGKAWGSIKNMKMKRSRNGGCKYNLKLIDLSKDIPMHLPTHILLKEFTYAKNRTWSWLMPGPLDTSSAPCQLTDGRVIVICK